jgi:putative addiction module component (TIGR02574 family)
MSKEDILDQLPRLGPDERRQILERLFELQDNDLVRGSSVTAEERALLDSELADYERNPNAGRSWEDVERRLLGQSE